MRRTIIAIVALAMSATILSGCIQDTVKPGDGASISASRTPDASESGSSASSSAAATQTRVAIAYEIGDMNAQSSIALENQMGVAITDIAVKPVSKGAYPEGLLKGQEAWKPGEAVRVHYSGEAIPCDVLITCDDKSYELHGVDLESIEYAQLKLDLSIAYLAFEHDGVAIDTLAEEQVVARAQADEATVQAAQAEAAAQAQAASSEPAA